MLRKITDFWPNLLLQGRGLLPDGDDLVDEGPEELPEGKEDIEEAFKNLRWTRVIDLQDYEEQANHVHSMADDILYGKQQMAAIKLDGLPQLCAHFDPIKWQEQNPQPHWAVYKLNAEQIKDWGAVATTIRKNINKKAANYRYFNDPEPGKAEVEKSRRQVPHSTPESNPEGLLESQIRDREKLHAGTTKSYKKRHLKELPLSTRNAIVRMYLVDHVYQCEVAQYYKVSPALVSKLVQEELRNPMRTIRLKGAQAEKHLVGEVIKKVVTRMLDNNVTIV